MTAPPVRPAPVAAVRAWWDALTSADLDALERMALPDYVSTGGPAGREVGRAALLASAAAFFAEAAVHDWQIDGLEVRDHGDVAVCSYRWREEGEHAGAPFRLAGFATDVLVLEDGGWRLQAHHVSALPVDLAASRSSRG